MNRDDPNECPMCGWGIFLPRDKGLPDDQVPCSLCGVTRAKAFEVIGELNRNSDPILCHIEGCTEDRVQPCGKCRMPVCLDHTDSYPNPDTWSLSYWCVACLGSERSSDPEAHRRNSDDYRRRVYGIDQ